MSRKTVEELKFLLGQNLNNLADIPDDEDLVIKYLLRRYKEGNFYTWVGSVLLAINPRQSESDLYSDIDQAYFTSFRKFQEPHVHVVAAKARQRLTQGLGKLHQVIIISGDSGSGKTFFASKILRFLTVTNRSNTLSKIKKACLVISPFCTASSERNLCSSRHGQLVKLQYVNGQITGAIVDSFLLEQSRVTSGSNNFHIFGQMLTGLTISELEILGLSSRKCDEFTTSACVQGFDNTVEAMNCLGFEAEQRQKIFRVVAIIVHLGKIQFKEHTVAGCDVDLDRTDSVDALEAACGLMALPIPDFVRLLTTSLIRPRSLRQSTYHSVIASTESCYARLHSITRYLYHRLFYWLVNRLNEILTCGEGNPSLLGILDIFGFKHFSQNSIEQLSINYANERMQLHFMQKYLETGRAELASEGLSTLPPPLTSYIYDKRLAAIECSLFPVLNDACLVARIDKHTIVEDLVLSARDEDQKLICKVGERFSIHHYSCLVEYETDDILRKNTDKVPAELQTTFSLCQNEFLRSLIDCEDEIPKSKQRDGTRVDKRKNTALPKLKQSMDELVTELNKYDLHYIRCVKRIDRLDNPETVKEFRLQLASSGILDALPLARCALPIRLRYNEFRKRYSGWSSGPKAGNLIPMCKVTLRRVLMNEEEFQSSVHFGSRLIFLAETVLDKLELMRDDIRAQSALGIQRYWRKYKTKKERLETVDRALSIDKLKNGFKTHKEIKFFQQDGILSRRRLPEVPVRFHTKLTCLRDSHRLPRSELPAGLADCL